MDLKVNEKYLMGDDEVSAISGSVYIRKGAVVRVIQLYGDGHAFVQDLSDNIFGDGSWIVDADKLEPLKETVSYASEALAHYTAKEEANKHYITAHQPIEVMQANMTKDELIGFLKGNIIKYACRCGRKDAPLKEAEKIKQYAEWLCVVLSGDTIDPRS